MVTALYKWNILHWDENRHLQIKNYKNIEE